MPIAALLLWRRLKRTCLKLFRLPFGYIWHHDALRSDSAGSAAMSFCHEPSCISGVSFGAEMDVAQLLEKPMLPMGSDWGTTFQFALLSRLAR